MSRLEMCKGLVQNCFLIEKEVLRKLAFLGGATCSLPVPEAIGPIEKSDRGRKELEG
ncbi:MAG: hypothetical protein U0V70_10440 [Terriglobia bacterium]